MVGKKGQIYQEMQNKTCFLGCSKTKRKYPCKALDMYLGVFFKKSLYYAKREYNNIYILSAKYGILELEQKISPYDKYLGEMNKKEKKEWRAMIDRQLYEKNIKPPFVFLCGKDYCFSEGEQPLKGLGIGKILSFFTEKNKNFKPII